MFRWFAYTHLKRGLKGEESLIAKLWITGVQDLFVKKSLTEKKIVHKRCEERVAKRVCNTTWTFEV